MENATHPIPPNKSCGCFNCGEGKDEYVISQMRNGVSVGLCKRCVALPPDQINKIPFDAR